MVSMNVPSVTRIVSELPKVRKKVFHFHLIAKARHERLMKSENIQNGEVSMSTLPMIDTLIGCDVGNQPEKNFPAEASSLE
jgi:hypothetical protein